PEPSGFSSCRPRIQIVTDRLANELGLRISVCPFLPGTRKWNKIEHQMFCYIPDSCPNATRWRSTRRVPAAPPSYRRPASSPASATSPRAAKEFHPFPVRSAPGTEAGGKVERPGLLIRLRQLVWVDLRHRGRKSRRDSGPDDRARDGPGICVENPRR